MNQNVTAQVQALYERHPYPHYPILAKPRWQDGYLGSSLFAQALFLRSATDTGRSRTFLSIGSGEMLPYIILKWEPRGTAITCVDLSRRSIQRAKFRTALSPGRLQYIQDDINQVLSTHPCEDQTFDHIEAYGVIHHIASMRHTVTLIKDRLAPQGLVRIMVYNSRARDWIWHINRGLRVLGLSASNPGDLALARSAVDQLGQSSPLVHERLAQMGYFTGFTSDTRFADTFLHPWEARLSIQKYFELFDDCGLKPVGLFDRYGELDDLQNPLWHMPSVAELSDRANDLRFENNLEIWLTHKDRVVLNEVATAKKIPLNLRSKLPPARWTSGEETKSLSLLHRLILWHGWLYTLYGHEHSQSLDLISKLPLHTAQRLARIGAILPSQADQCGRMKELLAPRHTAMEPPILPLGGLIKKKEFDSICRNLLPNCEEERVTQALKRFESAACGIN